MRGEAHPRTSHSRHMPGATIRIAGRGAAMLTPSRLILYGAETSSQSWRPRWHKGSLPNSKATLMAVLLTRPCGSGSTARNTRSISEIRMPASSVGRSRPTSTMPARPDEDRAAGRGYGRSDEPRAPYASDDHLARVVASLTKPPGDPHGMLERRAAVMASSGDRWWRSRKAGRAGSWRAWRGPGSRR